MEPSQFSRFTRYHLYGLVVLLWLAGVHLLQPHMRTAETAISPRPRFVCAGEVETLPPPDWSAPDPPRPYLFGCGISWGKWLHLSPEASRQWDANCLDAVAAMGATCVNIQDSAWPDIEAVRGVYDWSGMDASVEAARRRGLEIFAFTGMTPDWALPPEALGRGVAHRYPPQEAFAADFERFYEILAARYKGGITYYTFWNEENGCGWINEGCRNSDMAHTYVPWLKRWYRAMKRGDPDCVLAMGGLDYHSGVTKGYQYLEAVYACGGGDSFDHVAIHPYGDPLHWRAVTDTYACLVRHGQGHKKIWIGEYGLKTEDEERKSRYLEETLIRLQEPDYRYVFHASYLTLTDLRVNGHDFGLCDGDFDSLRPVPRPSYETFARLAADASRDVKTSPDRNGAAP